MKHFRFNDTAVVLAGAKASKQFLEPIFAQRSHEVSVVAFCDNELRVIDMLWFPGEIDSCEVSFKEIARHAKHCTAFLMAHNHPSGNPQLSRADIGVARRFANLADALNISLLDYLVFAEGGIVSARQMGLL